MNNFYPLPEWHPQSATILVWPHRYSDWESTLGDVCHTYLALIKAITAFQAVVIIYYDHQHEAFIKKQCMDSNCDMQQLTFIQIETNDTWVRDYGPQILLGNSNYQYLDFEFNAWGEQYPCRLDNLFAETLFNHVDEDRCEYYRSSLVIEGGNLEFDSSACLLTNIASIKRNNPNLQLTDEDLIEKIKFELSLRRVLTVDVPPLGGDDTGGHIDTLARFIDDNTIAYAATSDSDNPNFSCLALLQAQLETLKTRSGEAYKLVPIPMPNKIFLNSEDEYLPASYINFIFVNSGMIIPLYDDKHDKLALSIYAKACPDRKVIGVHANELIKQFGSIHCATLHIPEKVFHESRLNTAQ